ncbi:methyltransferase [Apibacter muscae]|uniref:THUMP-like domain-containing protein n=1 Tax=Apibacter muscae TaxID=2509004 RepID=UPI0011AC6338|nr:class I SAM-dependent methyltransferase [Apibacter muscae]TWP28158.1 methyltransferase [Apibacter muscae]
MDEINLLDKKVQEYIYEHINADLVELRMKKSPFKNISSLQLVQQIQGKRIAQKKFPILFNNDQIIYPPHLNLEQASSQSTALFKQKIIEGKIGTDLTGGMGIDTLFLSENRDKFYYVEPNLNLFNITKHNFKVLKKDNIVLENCSAEEFISKQKTGLDFIFMDPSRRDENKNKKILLEDLCPNVMEIKEQLFKLAPCVYIKLSPLLDIKRSIELLPIQKIYILSVKNEVKELIFKLHIDSFSNNPEIHCINLESNQPSFNFNYNEENRCLCSKLSVPKKYLYMPNASILKSGAFKLLGNSYQLDKLDNNTHIYTLDIKLENFPGRIFKVIDLNFQPNNYDVKKFNIITKNYPLNIDEIKKKYKLLEGGNLYLIFLKAKNKTYKIVCSLV